jgi:DNA-binding MarR family transcriptional regulator
MDSASLAGLVAEVALRLQRRLRQELAVHGLTGARLATLKRVVAEGGSTVGKLAVAEGVASPTMSRIIDGLETEKLVLRRRSSRDGRVVEVLATTLGRTLASGAERHQLRWLEGALQELNERDRRAIAEVAATLARIQDELGVTDE